MDKCSIYSDISTANLNYAVDGENIFFSYNLCSKSNFVINNLTIKVKPSICCAIIGPEKSGKSTILKIIANVLNPQNGSLKIYGQNVNSCNNYHHSKAIITFMPQNCSFLPQLLTVNECLHYFCTIYGILPQKSIFRVQKLTRKFNFLDKNHLICDMNYNQQKIIAILSKIIVKPNLLLLDAPFDALDPQLVDQLWTLFDDFLDETTIIMTSDWPQFCGKTDTIAFLKEGQLIVQASLKSLMKIYRTANLSELCMKIFSESDLINCERNEQQIAAINSSHCQTAEASNAKFKFKSRSKFSQLYRGQLRKTFIEAIRLSPMMWLILLIVPSLITLITLSTFTLFVGKFKFAIFSQEIMMYNIVHASSDNFSIAYDNYLIPYYPQLIKERLQHYQNEIYNYTDLDDAVDQVDRQVIDAVLHFRTRFSQYFSQRILPSRIRKDFDDELIKQSTIDLYLDSSNYFKSQLIQLMISKILLEVILETASALKVPKQFFKLPIIADETIYGKLPDKNWSNLTFSGLTTFWISIAFASSLIFGLQSSFKSIKQQQLLPFRAFGFTNWQIVLSTLFSEALVVIIAAIVTINVYIFAFKMPLQGPYDMSLMLFVMMNLFAYVNGFFVGFLSKNVKIVVCVATISLIVFVFNENLFASFGLWPKKWLSLNYFYSIKSLEEAFKSIFYRENAPFSNQILIALTMCTRWTVMFTTVTVVIMKIKKL